nr:hypothetical protein [Tanacetum cinerariifolium]
MLEKDMYGSWKSIIELYMLNRQHGRMILESVENGPLLWPTVEENRVTRPKKYFELSVMEAIQADCDVKERIQLLMQGTSLMKQKRECKLYGEFDKFAYKKGESLRDFYLRFSLLLNDMNIYNTKLEQFQVNTKFLNTLPPEWSKFVTDIALMANLSHYGSDNLAENSSSPAQQDDLILYVIEQLKTQVINYTKINQDNKNVNEILTAELERYKDQVRILKEGNNVDKALDTRVQSLKIDNLKHTLSKHLKEKESLEQMTYKQLYDSIKSSRVRSKEQCDDLFKQVNIKSAKNSDLNASLQEKVLVITALKDTLSKLKGKSIVNEAVTLHHIDPELLKIGAAPLAPNLRNNRTAHYDYLKHTQEETSTLSEIVENERFLNPLNTSLDCACKYTKLIQEFLIFIKQTCPYINDLGTKLMVVTTVNNNKKIRFTEHVPSSGNTPIKTTSSTNIVSNKPVPSSTGVNLLTSASGSQPQGNTKKDRIQQT